jgi:Arc/MetJ-type ribon-helix-helix transcriptional regulator
MAEVKGQEGRQLDRERDKRSQATSEADGIREELVSLRAKVVELEAKLSKVHVTDEEWKTYWKVSSLLAGQAGLQESSGDEKAGGAGGVSIGYGIDPRGFYALIPIGTTFPLGSVGPMYFGRGFEGLGLSITLPEEIQRLLRSRVESGQFPSQQALIEAALRSFLIEEYAQETPERDRATEPRPKRLPSPFILDEWAFGPGEIPRRPGREVDCVFLRGEKRRPDRYPGE